MNRTPDWRLEDEQLNSILRLLPISPVVLKMSRALNEARAVLIKGGDLVELAEAIGTIIADPSSSLDDIRLGLQHGGLIAEQAAIALHRREGIPFPEQRINQVR
jgi:hypothetical protein